MLLPDDIGEPSSLLTDGDIRRAVAAGFLLHPPSISQDCIRYSSYELRVGEYRLVRYSSEGVSDTEVIDRGDDCVTLHPGETAKVFAMEAVTIPTNVLARVTPVGQIFSSGFFAETTFADPGYVGDLYVTLNNLSPNVLSIPKGAPLARTEFYKLGHTVDQPHDGAQARRPRFVRWSAPVMLDQAELSRHDLTYWLNRLQTFEEGERYDRRHGIAAHVIAQLMEDRQRLDAQIRSLTLAVYLVGAVLAVLLVALLWDWAVPARVAEKVSEWLVVTFLAVGFGAIVFFAKRFRKTLAEWLSFSSPSTR